MGSLENSVGDPVVSIVRSIGSAVAGSALEGVTSRLSGEGCNTTGSSGCAFVPSRERFETPSAALTTESGGSGLALTLFARKRDAIKSREGTFL